MLKVKLLDPHATPPSVQHPGEDLAFDLYALEQTSLVALQPTKVRTGISAVFTPDRAADSHQNYGLLIRDRSSMAAKGIATLGGVVDSGYRGEILVVMVLLGHDAIYTIAAGDKIAQMIPVPVLTGAGVQLVAELPPARRGERGFGSSGK